MTYTVKQLGTGVAVTCNTCWFTMTMPTLVPCRHVCSTGERVTYWPEGFDVDAYNKTQLALREEQKRLRTTDKPTVTPKGPTLLQRATNFNKARKQHRALGSPKASDEQVAERFAICSANTCGYYVGNTNGGKCKHVRCGCNMRSLGNESSVFPNKLRWADQKCPIGLWPSVVPPEESSSVDQSS